MSHDDCGSRNRHIVTLFLVFVTLLLLQEMDVFSKFVQTKNTMIMRKVLLLLLCCISGVVMAETRKDIDLKKNDVEIRPLSIMSEPTAYQADAVICISLPNASPYVTVSIVNEETGVQVYFMIYAGINNIQINLENEIEGIYTLKVNLEGTEYTGYFIR